jgi:ABC-type transport system involved in multi-copper enzyme maturation permease subunit
VLLATLVVAATTGTMAAQDYRDHLEQYQIRRNQLTTALARGGLMAVWLEDPGLRALRVPEPGSIWVKGADALLPPWWAFTPAGPVEGSADLTQGQDSQGVVVDCQGVIRVFLGLLAVVMGLESVAGERADGVLQSVLNQPIGWHAVLTAKLISGTVLLASALLLCLLTTVIAAGLTTSQALGAPIVKDALSIGGASLLYLVTLLISAMLLSSTTSRPGMAGVSVVSLWMYVSLLGPQLTEFGSRALAAVPSRPLLEVERQRSFDARFHEVQLVVGRAYRRAIGDASLTVRPVPTVSDAQRQDLRRLWHENAVVTREVVVAFDRRWTQAEVARVRAERWLRWISPASLFFDAASALEGTGAEAALRWRRLIWAHQDRLNSVFFDDPPRLPLYVPAAHNIDDLSVINEKLRDDVHARDLPRFEGVTTSFIDRLSDSRIALGGLAVYLAVSLIGAYLAFPTTGD